MDPQTDDAPSDWTEVSYKKPRPNRDRRKGGRNVPARSPPAKKGASDTSSARPARPGLGGSPAAVPGSSSSQQPRALIISSADWPKPGESRVQSKAGVAAREGHPHATVPTRKANANTRVPVTSGAAGNGQPTSTSQRKIEGAKANESTSISSRPSTITSPASQHNTSAHSVARGPPAPALLSGQSLSAPAGHAHAAPSLLFSPAPSYPAISDSSRAGPLAAAVVEDGGVTPTATNFARSGWDESSTPNLTPPSESSTPDLLSPPTTPRSWKTYRASLFRRRASSASLASSTSECKETTLGVGSRKVIDVDESEGRVTAVVRYCRFGTIERAAGPSDAACIFVFEHTFSPLPGQHFDGATVTIDFETLDSGRRNVLVEAVEPHKLVRDDDVQTTVRDLKSGGLTIPVPLPGGGSGELANYQRSIESSFAKHEWKTARGNGVGTGKAKFVYEQNKADKSGIETSAYTAVILSCPGGPFKLDMSMEITCPPRLQVLKPSRLSYHGRMFVRNQESISHMPADLPFQLDTASIGFTPLPEN